MDTISDQTKYSAMQTGTPYRKYGKTILGKVHVVALNPFTGNPEGVILEGNPAGHEEGCYIEIWDTKADAFFKRLNVKHFDAGRLSEITRALPEKLANPNEISDEEIDTLLSMKFLAFKSKLDQFTEEAPVFRTLNRARELDKSEKIIKRIEEKLVELQGR